MQTLLDSISIRMPDFHEFPASLHGLARLATNLYWSWHPEVQQLFRRVDGARLPSNAGPMQVLQAACNLDALSRDAAFIADVERVEAGFDRYMAGSSPAWPPAAKIPADRPIAYFCAEYAFYDSLNQYAGGLGILAGDHCKEASDVGLPFVAVGLFYRRGFFHQMVDWEGRQEHLYPLQDPETWSMIRVLDPRTQTPVTVSVDMPGRKVHAAVWLASVGRVPLILLDTDVEENSEEDRAITSQLYTNGRSMRLHQETILGVGGVRALRALGIEPSAWHLNEGHSALLLLERLREYVAQGKTPEEARAAVRSDSIITIHTPVPEGNERFGADLAGSLIAPILEGAGLDPAMILELGLGADADPGVFDMTAFALRHTRAANGVSRLHGNTADATWREIAGYPVIGVTNGVHLPTWLGPAMKKVYSDAGASLQTGTSLGVPEEEDRPRWDAILSVDDQALWDAHIQQKASTIEFARKRLYKQHARHGEGPEELRELMDALDPDAFLIGFARRFATYKRASLMFTDEPRLQRILNDPARPVQVLFAGKAHPSDRGGQALIEQVYRKTREPAYKSKIFLLEDYDVRVGRHLVRGVDMWLNNPRRPLEASGTSGMKAAANGIPNVSILDGWWDEAFEDGARRNGWAIGGRETFEPEEQDRRDAADLYRVLEEDVLPAFFGRDAGGLPARWLPVMKKAIATTAYAFSTKRMLRDYVNEMLSV